MTERPPHPEDRPPNRFQKRFWLVIVPVFIALAVPGVLLGGFIGWMCGEFTGDRAGIGEREVTVNVTLYTLVGAGVGIIPAALWLIGSFWAKR